MKLQAVAVCSNCGRKHYTSGKRVERRCKCGYWISAVDYTELAYKKVE